MDVAALLTSAGINITICVVLFSLYSVLRKQPSNRVVYFGRTLKSVRRYSDNFSIERFVPSPRWLVKAWGATEEEILAVGGMDAVTFQRSLIFSIRIFSIAAIVCMFLVLPVNYYGKFMQHKQISEESLDVFSIGNVKEGSKWFWCHCLALYIISCSACALLYFEYKSISKLRLEHIIKSPSNPSHFTILVRAIPFTPGESYSDTVRNFFTNYYASSYLSHQMVYRRGTIRRLINDAEIMCSALKTVPSYRPHMKLCCFCGGSINSFTVLSGKQASVKERVSFSETDLATRDNERPTAFVFFKSRYAAAVARQMLQSSNPMLWVTEMAPEPHDVLWSSISLRYKQLWLRKIATILVTTVFMFLFLIPVTFVQGLTQLDKLSRAFPFLRGLLKQGLINHVVTGYLPSVILILFLYTVPPTMSLLSTIEGPISRSRRKKSACKKILFFNIWNVFFVNILSGSVINQLSVFSSVRDIPTQLAKAVPTQASFFMTYVLTSGWASIGCELMQLFPLICNLLKKLVLKRKEDSTYWLISFPYHTEIPRVLLFGLLGFTCAVMAPLMLPFLLVYFVLAYLVYRNQILNVYLMKYDTGGRYWPIIHNTTVFSLILTQVIALGVFGLKDSPVALGFTIPLIFLTLLFNEYCRQRFYPIFQKDSAQVLIDLDRRDEQSGRTQEIYQQLNSAYCQFPLNSIESCESSNTHSFESTNNVQSPETNKSGQEQIEDPESWTAGDFGENGKETEK